MKKNILFVVDNLKLGGVTKVLSTLLTQLAKNQNLNIDLLVLHYYNDMKISLPENIRILSGGKVFEIIDENIGSIIREKSLVKLIKKILFSLKIKTGFIKYTVLKDRKALPKKYDAEIAFGDGFPYLYTAYGDSDIKIGWMHSDVCVMDHSARYFHKIKYALSCFDRCVAVSSKVAKSYRNKYEASNVKVIHNLMDADAITQKSKAETSEIFDGNIINLVSVGRLDHSKNYEMLIRVAERLVAEGFSFKLYIIGDGDLKNELEAQIERASLKDTVILCGRKDNPYPYIRQADLYILSSRYEGLPTVLYEALILKTPCISTRVAGADEIISDGFGFVTENEENAFYSCIKEIISNPEKLHSLKQEAAKHQYDSDVILEKINRLFAVQENSEENDKSI